MLKGKCLCGAIKIEVAGELEHQPQACHCSQCRKQSGHFLSAVNVRRSSITVTGEEKVTWYQSSQKVQRGFCGVCGSTLFWKPTLDNYEFTAIAMGLFDLATNTQLAKHTFVDDKGDYYEIDDNLPTSTSY